MWRFLSKQVFCVILSYNKQDANVNAITTNNNHNFDYHFLIIIIVNKLSTC